MEYISSYFSPLGSMTLAARDNALTGVWFDGQKYFSAGLSENTSAGHSPVLDETARWLDAYFSRSPLPPLPLSAPSGSAFRREVWDLLREIPYGQITTYGAIAKELAKRHSLASVSAQAVGGAVGHNPISILIPCHRVVGANGSLTGYAGGMERKTYLLALEAGKL